MRKTMFLKGLAGLLLVLCSAAALAQEAMDYKVVYFFRNSNADESQDIIFSIDDKGIVFSKDSVPTGEKVNPQTFRNFLDAFAKAGNLRKFIPTEENGQDEAYIAVEGEQALYLSVVLKKDYGKHDSGDIYYGWEYIGKYAPRTEYKFYQYMSPADLKVIRARLD